MTGTIMIPESYQNQRGVQGSIRRVSIHASYEANQCLRLQIWSDELVTFKESLGLPLGKKTDFTIPKIILEKNEWVLSFIRGFFDTDGCLYIQNKRGKPYPRL
ncbi:hypothetical protein JXA12_05670 [Candidatus Woesearchaeota archaeon]|nr:hypothetical protein [Candidatus Woesearchaeota archaeon]